MNRYATSGPVVVVPARTAALLERILRLDEVRVRLRGQDAEVDEVLLGWHAVAMQFATERADQARFRAPGTLGDGVRNSSDNWDVNEVAARSNCTTRAVRKAASEGRLVGEHVDGRWQFEPEAAANWVATRQRRAA